MDRNVTCYKFLKPLQVEIEHCTGVSQQENLSELHMCILTTGGTFTENIDQIIYDTCEDNQLR